MLAVVACRVPPAAVRVDEAFLLAIEGEMLVGFVHWAGAAFFLEKVDGVRQGVTLKEEFLNHERIRMHRMMAGATREIVAAFGCERVEIDGPVVPVAPFLDGPHVARWNGKD